MKKFYFKIPVSETEGVDVYMGQGSGRQLLADIEKARAEVLVVSPYIDTARVDDLIALQARGINVRLAFCDLKEHQESEILRRLIRQTRHVDQEKEIAMKRKAIFYNLLSLLAGTLGFIAAGLSAFSLLPGHTLNFYFLAALPLFLACGLFRREEKAARNTEIYSYQYTEKVSFKYLRNSSWQNEPMFIHSKIFIIDRRTAYLGSLNFTNAGFTSNFETRIRIVHREKVAELTSFVHTIFDDNNSFRAHDIAYLGRRVYGEDRY